MEDNKYCFYGWEDADITPHNPLYEKAGTPKDLYDVLSGIWCRETCAPRMQDEWSEDNKTLGQCSITAFLVQDIYGGEVRGILRPGGNYHCYNVVDGHVFDLTSEQFGQEAASLSYKDNPVQLREEHFSKLEKRLRYEKLRCMVQERLGVFRRMRRFGQQIAYEECYKILDKQWRGVLTLNGDMGYPHSFPMDFYFDPVLGKIYFHCAKEGYKIDLLNKDSHASFCVYDEGYRKDGHWALNINSIICYGTVRQMEDGDKKSDILFKFGCKYYPTEEGVLEEIRKDGKRVNMLEFTIDRMTGKLVNES